MLSSIWQCAAGPLKTKICYRDDMHKCLDLHHSRSLVLILIPQETEYLILQSCYHVLPLQIRIKMKGTISPVMNRMSGCVMSDVSHESLEG